MRLNDYCFKLVSKADGSVAHCVIRDCSADTALIRCQLMYKPDQYTVRRVPAVETLPFSDL